jgi:hypothetical protein
MKDFNLQIIKHQLVNMENTLIEDMNIPVRKLSISIQLTKP